MVQTSSGRERVFFILQRWVDIGAYAFAGSAFFAYAGSSLASLGSATLLRLTSDNSTAAMYLSLVAAAVALWLCHKLIGARLQHVRWTVFFPPLPVAVILAVVAAPLWPVLRDEHHSTGGLSTADLLIAGGGYAAFWLIQLLLTEFGSTLHVAFCGRESKPHWEGKTIDELTDDELTDWLRSETPVDDERRDLFSVAGIVERLLQRLCSGRNSIALQGAYGAGKSSIARMAEQRAAAAQQPLWFVRVSCWGFDNSALVQREVLNQVTQRVGEHVDCFSIRGLPQNYLDAVSTEIGWVGIFGVFVNRRLSPLQELQRLSPVLRSVGRDVVVVIEDVDRNGRNFDLSDIQALLARFREVDGISFVLTIANEQQVDFARVCEFVEVVPPLEEQQTLKLVHRVRAMCLDRFDDALPDAIEPLTADDDRHSVASIFFGDFRYWQSALVTLISNPRALKFTLRRVVAAWGSLHGEVNIDLLLISSALRTAASPAFSFLVENYSRILSAKEARQSRHGFEAEKDKPAEALQADWKRLLAENPVDLRNVSVLILQLLPEAGVFLDANTHTQAKRQGLSGDRGAVYARRLFSETLQPSEFRDQTALRLMKAADDSAGLAELARTMDASKEASAAFEHFVSVFKDFPVLPLLSEIYSLIRAREGRRYNRDDSPAFFAAWRVMRQRSLPPDFEDWLVRELERCIPGHLKLLNDIYYFWRGTDAHSRDERVRAREAVLQRAREQFTTLPIETFINSFDPAFPYTLFHLVFTSDYKTPDAVPFSSLEDWSWLGPILLRAVEVNPTEMMPQVLVLLGTDSKRDQIRLDYSFDAGRVEAWFGTRAVEFIHMVARGFSVCPHLDHQAKQLVDLAITEARRRVADIAEALPTSGSAPDSEGTVCAPRSRTGSATETGKAEPALKNGFDVFPKRAGDPVTNERVRQLCNEEGV